MDYPWCSQVHEWMKHIVSANNHNSRNPNGFLFAQKPNYLQLLTRSSLILVHSIGWVFFLRLHCKYYSFSIIPRSIRSNTFRASRSLTDNSDFMRIIISNNMRMKSFIGWRAWDMSRFVKNNFWLRENPTQIYRFPTSQISDNFVCSDVMGA